MTDTKERRFVVIPAVTLLALVLGLACAVAEEAEPAGSEPVATPPPALVDTGEELPVVRIPHLGEAAEAYFSPDGQRLIVQAKLADDDIHHTYTLGLDGSEMNRINDRGADACSFYFPDGDRLVWTSTRDLLDLEGGSYSDPLNYPQGAELYSSDLDGGNVVRLTDNEYYDAEVSVSPDGQWLLFGRQIDGKMDLWRMRPDGSEPFQITHTDDWEEGGAFYMPDSETILYRAWRSEDQASRGMPMTVFTIRHDGTDQQQITFEEGTNWAPYPAPNGTHFAFVKMLPPHNFEIYMMNIETGNQRRLTYDDAFDGFPAISPDGKTLAFSSSRDAAEGSRSLVLFRMDISSMGLAASD